MWNFCVHPTPNFLVRDWHSKISVNLEGVLPVVREKMKNGTVATFYDVYEVFGSENDQFFTFPSRMKVIQLFKAKMEAFRERKSSKVENVPFWLHLDPNFLERDENRFLTFCIPKPCANQCFWGHSVQRWFFNTNRDFACSLLVKNLMEFQWIWSPFGPFLGVTNERTDERTNGRTEDRAAQPAPPSRRTILSPWTGSAPPTPMKRFFLH